MILDLISLYNFGIYRGYQTLELTPPSREQPILLFGGLNGGGKTTLLDAIQLVLYGKLARCSNRGSLDYGDFLRRCIHMGPDNPRSEAGIILEFRHTTDGEESSYRIQRSWSGEARNITESVTVSRNGVPDAVLAEQWADFVEGILPSNIAHLFFFDGEKIEALADPARSADLLQSAIRSLLGLDLVDRLHGDLVVLERRQKEDALDSVHKAKVERLSAQIEELGALAQDGYDAKGSTQTQLDNKKKELEAAEQTFRREGGDLFEQRKQLEAEFAEGKGAQEQAVKELIQLTGQAETPLLMLSRLLGALAEQHQAERAQRDSVLLVNVLAERDSWLLEKLRALASASVAEELAAAMEQERERRASTSPVPSIAQLSAEAASLLSNLLPPRALEACAHIEERLEAVERLRRERELRERRLAAIPAGDKIAHLIEQRQRLQGEVEKLVARLGEMEVEHTGRVQTLVRLEAERAKLLEVAARDEIKRLDAQRLLDFSKRSRDTLGRFRDRVLRHNISRIEAMILESFQALMRKDNFVHGLRIDPETCELTLVDGQEREIEATRLSAGERQLLATAMLWGLARASGRSLPIVIDTPLGRLDSHHRANLVERYFPNASEQVILLSTDEEIDTRYHKRLAPHIGRSYLLAYNNAEGFTQVKPGYFWLEDLAS